MLEANVEILVSHKLWLFMIAWVDDLYAACPLLWSILYTEIKFNLLTLLIYSIKLFITWKIGCRRTQSVDHKSKSLLIEYQKPYENAEL